MIPRPGLLRHAVNILAALLTLAAPIVPMAHAAAMGHDAVAMSHTAAACGHTPATHHRADVPGHPAHQHSSSCCDFCGTGCTAPVLWAGTPAVVAAMSVDPGPVSMVPRATVALARPPHSLPLQLGPPALLA